MARIEGQKLKILVLADILARETDSAHGLTVPQLIEALAARGIPAERKSIYTDLRALEDFGLDVICLREGHICRWALASRTFEVAELKLLVDAVQSSKFLSEKKSRALIKKLESLCSRHEAKALQRQVFVTNRPKSMNESIYYTIDLLHTAISTDEQVRFQIAEWTPEKTVRYRRGGKLYTVIQARYAGRPQNCTPLFAAVGLLQKQQNPAALAYKQHVASRLLRQAAGLRRQNPNNPAVAELEQLAAQIQQTL